MRRYFALIVCWATFLLATKSASPLPTLGAERGNSQDRSALARIADSYEVKVDGTRAAKRTKEPAFRWNKPLSGIEDAILYLWTLDGRPVAAGAFVRLRGLGHCHEFQSLSVDPLEAKRADKSTWKPEAGVHFAPIPDAPAPAESRNRRLLQMTSLAEQFRMEAVKGPPFYPEDSIQQLRLLPKPLLRYSDPVRPELEGALFSFAHDTDPEGFLIIENRARDERTGWEFAMAPMTSWQLKGWHKDREIWSIERPPTLLDPRRPYFVAGPFQTTPD